MPKKINFKRLTTLVRDIKEREQVVRTLESEIDAAKDEIKQVMTANKLEELEVDVFTVRYQSVRSNRFDTKAFKAGNKDLYEMYLKSSETMKFTIT